MIRLCICDFIGNTEEINLDFKLELCAEELPRIPKFAVKHLVKKNVNNEDLARRRLNQAEVFDSSDLKTVLTAIRCFPLGREIDVTVEEAQKTLVHKLPPKSLESLHIYTKAAMVAARARKEENKQHLGKVYKKIDYMPDFDEHCKEKK